MNAFEYRIAFFTNTFFPFVGGVARSVELYQDYLTRQGDQVIVYAPEYDGAETDGPAVRRLAAIRHFNNTDFSLPLPLSFKTELGFEEEQFDLVHVHHPFLLGEMGMNLARQFHLPFVFTYHTMYEHYLHYVPFNQETAEKTILRHSREFCECCDLVIAPTSDVMTLLRERGVSTRIEVLPTGIEVAAYAQGEGSVLRRELQIPEGAPVLVHVGRLAVEKNLPFLMDALLKVLAARGEAHAVIVGEGPSEADLKAQASAAGMGERVHFLGRLSGEPLIRAFCAGDLFIFASQTETQGMVVAEAMAAGNPVIALDGSGMRDLIVDGTNGRLLPAAATAEDFAAAVLAALEQTDARRAWGEAAKRTAQALDMPLLAKRLHDLYAELKLTPRHQLRKETMSFGLIRNYFETVWEEVGKWFTEL